MCFVRVYCNDTSRETVVNATGWLTDISVNVTCKEADNGPNKWRRTFNPAAVNNISIGLTDIQCIGNIAS